METNVTDFNSLEQGLAGKVSELEAQRLMRETLLVDITLEAIANGVVSKKQDIIQLMSGKQWQAALREIVIREVKRAADERLWCREYDEKAKSNQRMLVYTGSHWESITTCLSPCYQGLLSPSRPVGTPPLQGWGKGWGLYLRTQRRKDTENLFFIIEHKDTKFFIL